MKQTLKQGIFVLKVKITFDELVNAYGSYRHVSKSPKNKNTVRRFCAFLGEGVNDELWEEIYKTSEVSEAVAHKLKWLTGPNARTLYKAWCAKHGN